MPSAPPLWGSAWAAATATTGAGIANVAATSFITGTVNSSAGQLAGTGKVDLDAAFRNGLVSGLSSGITHAAFGGSSADSLAGIANQSGTLQSNLLNVPDATSTRLGHDRFWTEVNKPFLDAAIARGDVIVLATKPERSVLSKTMDDGTIIRTAFGREYDHLLANGYSYDFSTGVMVREAKR